MEIATAIGGALLSPSFQLLLEKLTSLDLLNYAREGQVLDELDKWKKLLKKIYAVLDYAEEKQMADPVIKQWVDDLRDLAYDVDDVLDEFNTEVLRRKLEDVEPAPSTSKIRKLIPTCCVGLNPSTFKFNADMVSKIRSITARFDEIIEEKDKLRLADYSGGDRTRQLKVWRATSPLLPAEEVCGREKDKLAVLDLLKAEASNANLSVIPIVGMGGVGKTTLAQLIYNDGMLQFDFKAWVSIGEDFDTYRVSETILKKVGGGDAKDFSSVQEELKEKLSGKKFLIILDDVWTEDYEKWTCFRAPFVFGAPGSTLIVTSRSREVARIMGTVDAYALEELSFNDCLSVFAQHALGAKNFEQHLDLEEMGKEMVKRCKGLPLAAKALGGLLRGKSNTIEWRNVLKSEIWDLVDDKCNVLPALRLSYFHLPSHLKLCFGYCAIFPKDYEFDSKHLVLLWMAEGFLHQGKGKMEMEELGDRYFCDLLSRSFFQTSGSNKSLYVMHDLINDLARSVSGETCFQLGDKLEDAKSCAKARHSSFSRNHYDIAQRFEIFDKTRRLRTLLALPIPPNEYFWGLNFLSRKVLQDLMPKLKCLRTLSLSGYQVAELPSSIGVLKHLRYLNLSHTRISKLPESLCKLINLQILLLRGCKKLVELPKGIHNLINLLCLDIRGTDNLKEMPLQFGSLKNLCKFSKFLVGKGAGLGINKLMKASPLHGQLCISGLQNVADIPDAEYANLKQKEGLKELELEWIDDEVNGPRNVNDEFQVLNALQPHQNISSLSIQSFGGLEFPLWIGNPIFTSMVQLELCNCHKVTSLPPLGRLPSLKELSIQRMDGLKEVGVEFYEDSSCFACLETLCIIDMFEWERWSWSEGLNEAADTKQFPKLHTLQISNCPKLVEKLPNYLPSLKSLDLFHCPQVVDLPKVLPSLARFSINDDNSRRVPVINGSNASNIICLPPLKIVHTLSLVRNMSNMSYLTSLNIGSISGLVSLPEPFIHALVALKNLYINYCHELAYLWRDGTNLDNLFCLETLEIISCSQLVSLVEGEEGLLPCNLKVVRIKDCDNFKKLPNGLPCLISLRVLELHWCSELVSFPDKGLPNGLEVLHINGYPSSPHGGFPSSLKNLTLLSCTSQVLDSLYNGLPRLTNLKISRLSEFPERGLSMPTLETLMIWRCEELRYLPNQMQNLKSLQALYIVDCSLLESFPVSGLPIPTLAGLSIEKCNKLKSLPNQIQNLTSLRWLDIYFCEALVSFPEGGLPRSLTHLSVVSCNNWTQPISEWGLHRLDSLRELRIEGPNPSTDMIVSFPDNDGLLPSSLTSVKIEQFRNLRSISRGIHSLTSLRELRIWECSELKSLPEEGLPATLEHLHIVECPIMERRCLKDKGDLWPIIAPVPSVTVEWGWFL